MPISDNIKILRKRYGITQKELAKIAGVTDKAVSTWELGTTEPRMGAIQKIADHFNLQKSNIIEDEGMNIDQLKRSLPCTFNNVFKIEAKHFPLLKDIICGEPLLASKELEVYIEVGANLIADFCLRAKGDSMIGARIYDGDIVFIRKQPLVQNGEIAAVLINDEPALKRVQYDRENNEISLFAENPQYKTLRFSGDELNQVRILGKAIAFQSDIK